MKLLTVELARKLPKLGATEHLADTEKRIIAKFFTPDSSWTWYALEFDGEDTFFGLVQGFETEYGYFSLSELAKMKGPYGLRVERDRHFEGTIADILKKR